MDFDDLILTLTPEGDLLQELCGLKVPLEDLGGKEHAFEGISSLEMAALLDLQEM